MYKIINRRKLIATIAADIVGKTLFWPTNIFKKAELINPENVREILIIRTAYIGDVVMALPLLKVLKDRFPNSRITFLTSTGAKEVLVNNPYIDEILIYDPFWFYHVSKKSYIRFFRQFRKKRFDLIIEARGDIRDILLLAWPAKAKYKVSHGVGGGAYLLTHVVPYNGLKHKVEYHLDLARFIGCRTDRKEWGIYLTDKEKELVKQTLKDNQINGCFLCAHPGARLPLKTWPREKCSILYDMLIDKYGIPLVILGSEGETEIVESIVRDMRHKSTALVGRLNLRELAGILSETALFICNDSAPMHIAAAMKTPTVAIFGPSKSRETGPYGNKCRVVEKDFPCRFTCDENVCKHKVYNACMRAITCDDVYNAAKDLIETSTKV